MAQSTPAKQKIPAINDAMGVTIWLSAFFGIGLLFVWVGAAGARPMTAILWVFACFVMGGLIGFLFGIPKVLQGTPTPPANAVQTSATTPAPTPTPAPAQPPTDGYDLRVNTNLEQISDWLTKIIVGLGLVELRTMPARLKSAARYIASGLDPSMEFFAGGLIVYFTILGFIGTYLITRLYITGAFKRADMAALNQEKQDEQRVKNIELPALGSDKALAEPDRVLSEEDKKAAKNVASKPLSELASTEEVSVWAKAQLSLGNYGAAVEAFDRVANQLGSNPDYRFVYATALYYSGNKDRSFQQLMEAQKSLTPQTDPKLRRNIYRSLTFQALLQKPPKSFDDAILFGEKYVGDSTNLVSPGVWSNLAAAYGQKMTWLLANNPTDQATIDQTKARALAVVQQTTGMGERWKKKIREMMDKNFPNKDPQENDLEVFATDSEFRKAAGLP